MSFVSLWKVVSILLTGIFGVLGLLKDYKDKETGKVTKWGAMALSGILIFATFGTVAQIKETSDDDKAKAQTAAQTLQLAQKTQLAVSDIQRLLNPITAAKLTITWQVNCANTMFQELCENEKSDQRLYRNLIPLASFHEFHNVFSLPVRISIFKSSGDADKYVALDSFDNEMAGDLDYNLVASAIADPKTQGSVPVELFRPQQDDNIELMFPSQPPVTTHSSGRLVSLRDLLGTTVVISDFTKGLYPRSGVNSTSFARKWA